MVSGRSFCLAIFILSLSWIATTLGDEEKNKNAVVPIKSKHSVRKNDDDETKTESETNTETKDGFRTVTRVTKHMKMNKNKAPEVIGQTVESVTTNVYDPKKPEKFQAGKLKKPGFFFDLFSPFKNGIFADDLVKQCSSKKKCNKPGMYCDKMDFQCRKKLKLDERCDQEGQCEESNGKDQVACLWGRCSVVPKSVGSAGLFCKKNKDCKSEELYCALQNDISEVSKVCVFKLSEGQTCGRNNIFRFLPFRLLSFKNDDLPCKKGFSCEALRFTGRKICRREEEEAKN